ncbi:DUF3466 family protein [Pseudoduganella lutea]|uniref:DUF3466 family protein n=1 Tax=Pseudoduganella lutea TaxID=321985 RepID=A0A4P6KRK1_9BURK|nr:DUF3466 family protein [Pseudoduganella lutea]QBE61689.1 DUF3466 family protein [Pseudoduganella lutea]
MKTMAFLGGLVRGLVVVLVCATASPARAEADPPPYSFAVRPLGTLPGLSNFDATAINDLGHVIGNATDAGGRLHTFLYDGARMVDIAPLSALNATVSGINNAGQIVGSAGNQAVMYSAGRISYLGTGTVGSGAAAINDAGQATGWAQWSGTSRQAVIFDSGSVRAVTWSDSWWSSEGVDINEHGDVAGAFNQRGSNEKRPTLFYADGSLGQPYLDNAFWSQRHMATGINDAGQMVGWFETHNGDGAYLFENGVTHALNPLRFGRRAYDINNHTQIVGEGGIWESDGILYDIADLMPADSPWRVTEWDLINDRGQVVASACLGDACQLVLLNPVPEPQVIAMLGAGLALLGLAATRHRRLPAA